MNAVMAAITSRYGTPLAAAVVLSACTASGPPSATQHYRCEHGIEFSIRLVDDSALIDGPRGRDVLFRDAGGQGPQQAVYSNSNVRAEFGLGAGGREARLHYPRLPLAARCILD